MQLKSLINRFKPYVRWGILALTLGFLLHTLRQNWQQVITLQFTSPAIALLICATGVTLLAHIWSGWVWAWVVQSFDISVSMTGAVIAYLKTNLAKYLPGNVWHFIGRIQFLRTSGASTRTAVMGVVLEPLLMAAAALIIVVVSQPSAFLQSRMAFLQGGILLGILIGVHPRILNLVLKRLTLAKLKKTDLDVETSNLEVETSSSGLSYYPLKPLLGEVLFVLIRGTGFLLAFSALAPVSIHNWGLLVRHFSLAWVLGLVLPGAPGGLGVFEATAVALLKPQFSAAIVLGAVALYRLISTIAEALGAGLAMIDERWNLASNQERQGKSSTLDTDSTDRQTASH